MAALPITQDAAGSPPRSAGRSAQRKTILRIVATTSLPHPDAPPAGSPLDATERGVVLRARAEASRFGWEGTSHRPLLPPALRRILTRITGLHPAPSFADSRLERLRLFACMMRRGDSRADAMAEALLRDGFSEAALREALTLVLS